MSGWSPAVSTPIADNIVGLKFTDPNGAAVNGTAELLIDAAVRALMTGEPKQSLTLEFVNNQAVLDPAKTQSDQQVRVVSQVGGLTGASGGSRSQPGRAGAAAGTAPAAGASCGWRARRRIGIPL